jgi:hypothetical protein
MKDSDNENSLILVNECVEAGDFQVDTNESTLNSMVGSKLKKIELSHENKVTLHMSCGREISIETLCGTTYIDAI